MSRTYVLALRHGRGQFISFITWGSPGRSSNCRSCVKREGSHSLKTARSLCSPELVTDLWDLSVMQRCSAFTRPYLFLMAELSWSEALNLFACQGQTLPR